MANEMTHYEVLGASPTASQAELRKLYVARARHFHPDNHLSSSAENQQIAAEKMQALNAAWAVLGDTEQRGRYDRDLQDRGIIPPHEAAPGPDPSEPPKRNYRNPKPPKPPRSLTMLPTMVLFAAAGLFFGGFILGSSELLVGAVLLAVVAAVLFFLVPLAVMRRIQKQSPE